MISVLIPVYNRPQMLSQAVESVLAQSYRDFELIVIDDGSTQDLSAVRDRVERAGHAFIRKERGGVAAARNAGIEKASGLWIALLDSDDYWHEKKLARQVQFHAEHPELKLSQCEERWHRHGKRVNKKLYHAMASGEAFKPSLERCCISASSIMLHREVFEDVGVFDEQMAVCEDYDLWIRVTRKYQIGLIDEELIFKFGGHEDQLSQSQPAMDRFRAYALVKLLTEADLTNEQRQMVKAEAEKKILVLRQGAQKHAPQMVPLYNDLLDNLSSGDTHTALHELRSVLMEALPHSK